MTGGISGFGALMRIANDRPQTYPPILWITFKDDLQKSARTPR
jgi:hypothetical protein